MRYYLDFSNVYRYTTTTERIKVRREMTQTLRDSIMDKKVRKQKNVCWYCARPITMADHLDHLLPVSRGGNNDINNLVAACVECNMFKGKDILIITNLRTIKIYKSVIAEYDKYCEEMKKQGCPINELDKAPSNYYRYNANLWRAHRNSKSEWQDISFATGMTLEEKTNAVLSQFATKVMEAKGDIEKIKKAKRRSSEHMHVVFKAYVKENMKYPAS